MPSFAEPLLADQPHPLYWELQERTAEWDVKMQAQERDRLSISIVNIKDAHRLLRGFKIISEDRWTLGPIPPGEEIPIELRITVPGFAPDYFFETGFNFVSADFRRAADFPGTSVQYLDAPCTLCTPEAKAKDYKALWVHHFEDVLDPDRTILIDPTRHPLQRSTYVYREGQQVPGPVFQLGIMAAVMLTDKAARRIAAEGLTGVTFEDLTRLGPDGQWARLGE